MRQINFEINNCCDDCGGKRGKGVKRVVGKKRREIRKKERKKERKEEGPVLKPKKKQHKPIAFPVCLLSKFLTVAEREPIKSPAEPWGGVERERGREGERDRERERRGGRGRGRPGR